MSDGWKAIGGLALGVVFFFGINALVNRAPEPVRNVMDSPAPLVELAGEALDGATSDAEDRFIAAAKQTEVFRLVPGSRDEMVEMGYWICVTTPEQRRLASIANTPDGSPEQAAVFEQAIQPLVTAAHSAGLCQGS